MVQLKTLFALLPILASMAMERGASPIKREVPQGGSDIGLPFKPQLMQLEKSHQKFVTATQAALQLNNPAGIVDP
jgi:hypothetical protein